MFRVNVKGFLVMLIFEVYVQNSNGNSILTINFNCDLMGYFGIICYYHKRMYRIEALQATSGHTTCLAQSIAFTDHK